MTISMTISISISVNINDTCVWVLFPLVCTWCKIKTFSPPTTLIGPSKVPILCMYIVCFWQSRVPCLSLHHFVAPTSVCFMTCPGLPAQGLLWNVDFLNIYCCFLIYFSAAHGKAHVSSLPNHEMIKCFQSTCVLRAIGSISVIMKNGHILFLFNWVPYVG